jgi:hypothetical protein
MALQNTDILPHHYMMSQPEDFNMNLYNKLQFIMLIFNFSWFWYSKYP